MRGEEAVEVLQSLARLARHQLAVLPHRLVRELPTRQHLGGHELIGAHPLLGDPPTDPRLRLLTAADRQRGAGAGPGAGSDPDALVVAQHRLGLSGDRLHVRIARALGHRDAGAGHARRECDLVGRRLQGCLRGQEGPRSQSSRRAPMASTSGSGWGWTISTPRLSTTRRSPSAYDGSLGRQPTTRSSASER